MCNNNAEKITFCPIAYAKAACDTMIKRFSPEQLPPIGHFHYHQGVFLSGMYQCYLLTGEEKYFDYIKGWVDSIIDKNGEIHWFSEEELDDIQPGILLFPLIDKTKDERYEKALHTLMEVLKQWPKNEIGGFWHKASCDNEMWLDGLYMAGPIQAEYASRYGEEAFLDTAVEQALLMYRCTRDEKTGLLYHAYDCTCSKYWANSKTGLAPEFWGRAIGWFLVAVLDILHFLPNTHPQYEELKQAFVNTATAVSSYRDEKSGMWYQVVDKGYREDNWLESSCTALFSYSLMRGSREGYLAKEYLEIGAKGYEGLNNTVCVTEEGLSVSGICVGTCVGDYEFYAARPTSENDLHGMGAYLLMCCEMARNEAKDA